MKISHTRVLLTGATGGIGSAIARALIDRGACVLLSARSEPALKQLQAQLGPERLEVCAADLTKAQDRERLCARAREWRGGIDTLINNAGVSELRLLDSHAPMDVEKAVSINLVAPMEMCRELLPHLRQQASAHIVNIGSVMGSLGFPGYSVYCATKFGLRGFTEALRRELADSTVRVCYLAPRATQTPMNSPAVVAMNEALTTRSDPPERVANELIGMLEHEQAARVIGWPEKLFARLNQIFPRLIDGALRKQLPIVRRHASQTARDASSTRQHDPIQRKSA